MKRYRHADCGGGWEQTEDGNLRCIKCGEIQKVVTSVKGVRAAVEPLPEKDLLLPHSPSRGDDDANAVANVRHLIALYKGRNAGLVAINELERAIGDRE